MTNARVLAQSASNNTTFRNRIINGNMMIDQRNAGASVTPSTNAYTLDRWVAYMSVGSKFSVQQNAGSVTPPVGFTKYAGMTSLSAYTAGSTDYFSFATNIEGVNVADLGWGSANAQPITLSFQVRSSLTGTHGGAMSNATGTRWYPFSFSITTANTWTAVTVTIPGDATGTWVTDSGLGLQMRFNLGAGATYSGPANTWSSSTYVAPTGAVSIVGTNGATFYITGVQLEKGTSATPFEQRLYGTELALCQRYYQVLASNVHSSVAGYTGFYYPVQMRAAPTWTQAGGAAVTIQAANVANGYVYGTTTTSYGFTVSAEF